MIKRNQILSDEHLVLIPKYEILKIMMISKIIHLCWFSGNKYPCFNITVYQVLEKKNAGL